MSSREMERFAVTAATGGLGPVLKKLSALLGDEYKLQDGTRRDIESIKSELEPVHDLLGMLWGRLDLDVACKDWMTEARELSYDMEDAIDSFTLGLERGNDSFFIQREATDSPFKELIMKRLKDLSQWCGEMQKVGDTTCNSSKLSTDPRANFLHKDESELVGMEEQKEELIDLLEEHDMVCITGPGGMGKTTLADLVYHKLVDKFFDCGAFVSLHPNPNMVEILGIIFSQVTYPGAPSAAKQNMVNVISKKLHLTAPKYYIKKSTTGAGPRKVAKAAPSISQSQKSGTELEAKQNDLIKGISTFLSDKSYLVIIDDIWHWAEWEVIRKALPNNNRGYKLIMTTRVCSITEKCRTEQGAAVYRPYFRHEDAARLSAMRLMSKSVDEGTKARGLFTKIAKMCGGPPFWLCPLAVICLSSAWADWQQGGGDGEWDTWASHILDDGFLSTPSLKPLVQSLCLGFDDLPLQLKTCLLYCTVQPLQHGIDRGCRVRKCIAEGFVSQVEVAQAYFDELVSRGLLQRDKWTSTVVDPIIGAFLVCKAKEDNFMLLGHLIGGHSYDGPGSKSAWPAKQTRRFSQQTGSLS